MAANNQNLSLADLAAQYGYAANFFYSDPELTALINQATKEQWSVAKFQAKFMASNWYRSHAASVRTWVEENARDPQTAARQIQQTALKIRDEATQMGASLDDARIQQMARDSLMWGWNDQELKDAIGSELQYKGSGSAQGQAGSFDSQIRAAANDYGLTVSDNTVGTWIRALAQGSWTMDNVTSQLKDWAMSKYPGLNAQLGQGMTVRQIADPYIQSYAQILEKPAQAVQLDDPLLQKALQGTPQAPPAKSGSTGQPGASNGGSTVAPPMAPQSLYDFENTLRQDPRWLTTQNAHQSMQNAAMGILRDWGLYK